METNSYYYHYQINIFPFHGDCSGSRVYGKKPSA